MGLAKKLGEVHRADITRLAPSVSIYKNTLSAQLKCGLNPFVPQKKNTNMAGSELHTTKMFDGLR